MNVYSPGSTCDHHRALWGGLCPLPSSSPVIHTGIHTSRWPRSLFTTVQVSATPPGTGWRRRGSPVPGTGRACTPRRCHFRVRRSGQLALPVPHRRPSAVALSAVYEAGVHLVTTRSQTPSLRSVGEVKGIVAMTGFRDLSAPSGFVVCWSTTILSPFGLVNVTIQLYSTGPAWFPVPKRVPPTLTVKPAQSPSLSPVTPVGADGLRLRGTRQPQCRDQRGRDEDSEMDLAILLRNVRG